MDQNLQEIIDQWRTHKKHEIWHGLVFIYFISDGEFVKIGKANNPQMRIKQIQTGNARELYIMGLIACESSYQANMLEGALHKYFNKYRKCGEWFDIQKTYEDQIKRYSEKNLALEFMHNNEVFNMYRELIIKSIYELGWRSNDKDMPFPYKNKIRAGLKELE